MNMKVTSNQMADEIETCKYCDRIVDTPNFAYHICTGRKFFKGSRPTPRATDTPSAVSDENESDESACR